MTFTKEVCDELGKPLDRKHVKPPPKGKYGDYVEAWHVITEANRIFGFGGWSYSLDALTETARDVGKNFKGEPQLRVGARAIVTVTVAGVTRQDVGHGEGQGNPAAPAAVVESAEKEAVSDALKRALRTFGYPFGLALYDKTKAHVADDVDAPAQPKATQRQAAKEAQAPVETTEQRIKRMAGDMARKLRNCPDMVEFDAMVGDDAYSDALKEIRSVSAKSADWLRDVAIEVQQKLKARFDPAAPEDAAA